VGRDEGRAGTLHHHAGRRSANDPRDVPKFLEALKNFDCVCGTRVEARSQGDNFVRIASSRIANWVRNKLSGETISDAGCCFRAFRRECVAI
jgi:hypothetical protein